MDYSLILFKKFPDTQWLLEGDDYDGLVWLSETDKPSKKTLDDLWETVKAEVIAEKESKDNFKITAIAKLAALGLTEDEAKAIIG
jgi:hypothetical protein